MKKRAKQLTALLLSAAMTFGMVTTSASAAGSTSSSDDTSSSTTATSSSTGSSSSSSTVLSSFDDETLSVMAMAITDESTSTDSTATEEEQEIKDEIYNDIFLNSDSAVDVSGYSTDTATMEALTDEVLEENNASDLVTVTYEEDELTGEATIMTVEMDPEYEAVTEEVSALAVTSKLTDDQVQTLLDLYAQYLNVYNTNVAYLGRQTAWYTSYEMDDGEDELGPLGSLLVLAGYSVDNLREDPDSVYDTATAVIQMYMYAYQYGVDYYGSSIISAKDSALQAVKDAGCETEEQELMVLTDWMSNHMTFDMGYIMNQTGDVMACADPQTPDHYSDMYNDLYQKYYQTYAAYVSYGALTEEQAQGYAALTASSIADGIYTVWESCSIGGLGEGLGEGVCLGYSMTFAYLVQWLHPEIYAADGTTLTTNSSSWKTVAELNYETVTNTETVYTTNTTWDGQTYYALKSVETTVAKPDLAYSAEDETVTFTCETADVTYYYSFTGDEGDYTELTGENNVLSVSEQIPGTLYAYAELNGTKSEVNSVELTQKSTESSETTENTDDNTSSSEQSENETPVEVENTDADTLEATIGTTVTDYPLYVKDAETGNYVQDTDEDGNALYVQNYDETNESLFTTEETDYPVYISVTTSEDVTTTDTVFSTDADYIVDIVEIYYTTDISMFGVESDAFNSQHFWSVVKLDGKWYYLDTNYIDIYTECMDQGRVETNGDLNFNYFLFSDTTARSLYDGYYTAFYTLYENVATDTSYEGNTWMYFAASNIYVDDGVAYYAYDSTDLLSMSSLMGGSTSDYSSWSSLTEDDTEYKIVAYTLTSEDQGTATDFNTLVDFNEGQVYNPTTNSMEENDLITELYALHQEYEEIYPALSLTMALYDGKIYFNVANCVLTYDLKTGDVVKLKEYNEVGAVRDTTIDFGGMAYSVVNDIDDADVVVENPPIAGLAIYDGSLYVDVASNYGWISGKSTVDDTSSYGWEYAQSNYNNGYTSLMMMSLGDNASLLSSIMDLNTDNDNDEFMFSANFVDTIAMSTVTSTSLNYSTVSVEASCNHNAFTEERSEEGLINDGTRVEEEGTACEHHYLKYDETYYNKDDDGNFLTGTCYVCTICGKCLNDYDDDDAEEYEAAAASAGHDYVADESVDGGIVWADDYSSATVNNLVCDVCGDMTQTVIREDEDGNQKEVTVYGLDVLNEDDTVTVALDESSALTCTVEYEVSGTCNEGLVYTYTAYGPDGSDYEGLALATTEVQGEAGTHDYVAEDDAWTWTGNDEDGYTEATVSKVTCSVCGDTKENLDAVVTSETTEATCTEDGATVYTATATITDEDGNVTGTVTDKKTVTIPATGHTYGDAVWTWSEDYSTATVAFTCTAGDDTQTVEAEVTSVTTDPTCTEDGATVYTATATFDGTEYTDTRTVTIPATGHTYGDPEWTWSEDYSTATATFTCTAGDDTQTVNAAVTSETTDPTCTKEGGVVYTATATFNGETYTDEQISDPIDALGHEIDPETGVCTRCGATDISYGTMEISTDSVLYTEEAQEPEVLSVTSKAGDALEEGMDYVVSYENNVEIGTATVVVTGTGDNYIGTLKEEFTISELATPELTAISNTTSGVKITWSESENAKQYQVLRKKSGSNTWAEVGDPTDSTSYTDTTASSGTTYAYTVKCVNSTGTKDTSKYDTTGISIIYLAAGQVTSLANAKSGMTIKWEEVKGASGYLIYRKVSGSSSYGSYFKKISDGSTTSYTEGSTKVGESGTKYTYCVVPYYKDSDGNTTRGSHTAGKTKIRLSAGTVTSLSKSSSGVTIKWSKVEGATGYIVYRKTNKSGSTEYKKIKTITSGSTVSYKDTANKTNGTKYTYKVVPYYQATSSSSKVNGSFTSKSTYWVKAVSISSLKNSSSKKMTVKWGKNSKATGYQIQYSTSSDFSNAKSVYVKSTSTVSKTISSLTKGKKYYVRVRAYKSVSGTKYYSTWSSKKSVTISK